MYKRISFKNYKSSYWKEENIKKRVFPKTLALFLFIPGILYFFQITHKAYYITIWPANLLFFSNVFTNKLMLFQQLSYFRLCFLRSLFDVLYWIMQKLNPLVEIPTSLKKYKFQLLYSMKTGFHTCTFPLFSISLLVPAPAEYTTMFICP